jgi:hypothetical protein
MSGFVETQMDDADRAGVDYSLATEWVSHAHGPMYPDSTACGLMRYEMEARREYYVVSERVTCQPCLAAVERRHREREREEFYALDLEHDQGDPLWGDRGYRWVARKHRETID